MYNKRFYQKTNDKKILHKIGKQWITISLSALMAIGIGMATTHISASANNINTPRTVKVQNNYQSQNLKSNTATQANQLHHQILKHTSVTASVHPNNATNPTKHRVITLHATANNTHYHHYRKTSILKNRFKKTNNRRALKRSGYHYVSKYRGHFIFNKYAPNDKRARISRKINIRHHNWAKGKIGNLRPTLYFHKGHGWIKGTYKTDKKYRRTFKRIAKHYRRHNVIKHHYRKHGYRRHNIRHHKINRRTHKSPINATHKYLNTDKAGQAVTFGNIHKDGHYDELSTSDSDVSGISHILNTKNVMGYKFDHINDNGYKTWVFANELSNKKHAKFDSKRELKEFNNAVMQQMYSPSEIDKINSIKSRYNYLEHNEDSTKVNTPNELANYRQHVVDWVNFYRTDLYNLQPVSENTDFDSKAQDGANNNSDPEDMILGDSNDKHASAPSDVSIYFTDTDDADHDGTPGHRASVLNPRSSNVGVGVDGGRDTLYFDFGLNNDISNYDNKTITYPNAGVFPIDYANQGDEDYWGVSFIRPNSVKSHSYPSNYRHILINNPQVTVHDDTSNEDVDVSDVHNDGSLSSSDISEYNSAIYYKVNVNQLVANHQYTITISGDNVPNGSYTYTTKLFNLTNE